MPEIPSINPSAGVRPVQATPPTPAKTQAKATPERGDTVEISPEARLRSVLAGIPDVRADLVARVKAEIQAGTYDTTDKLDKALDSLMDDLGL
jgi:anti-sigma28 factor (negative regulator of flagellin synthesis)